MKPAEKLMEIAVAMRRCREEGEFDSSYLRDWADGIENIARSLPDPDQFTSQYTVSVNDQFEDTQTFVSEELARKVMSDWERIASEHGWNDKFGIVIRKVGPWTRLEDRS